MISAIYKKLNDLQSETELSEYANIAKRFLNNCKPRLDKIKNELGFILIIFVYDFVGSLLRMFNTCSMICFCPPALGSVLTASDPKLTKIRLSSPNGKVILVIFSNTATAYNPFPIFERRSFLPFHAVAALFSDDSVSSGDR